MNTEIKYEMPLLSDAQIKSSILCANYMLSTTRNTEERLIVEVALAAMTAPPASIPAPDGWTGNGDADLALVLLGRLDAADSDDDCRIEQLEGIIRRMSAAIRPQLEGWKLVPVEPTQEMVDAHTEGMITGGATKAYREMLAAAPAPGGVE